MYNVVTGKVLKKYPNPHDYDSDWDYYDALEEFEKRSNVKEKDLDWDDYDMYND